MYATHDPTPEEIARAKLRVSVSDNREQMHMTEESRLLLAALIRDEMRVAVAEGIGAAMNDKNAATFCRAMVQEAKNMAAEKSVEMAGGVLKAFLGKALTFVFLGSLVYAVGGWSALAAMGKFLFDKG